MSDIFISYAREDRPKAEQLAHAFEQQGWTVWWDKVIPPGRKYSDVITEELNSAGAVLVLWSVASAASDWVKDEAQEGVNRGVLLPVMVEETKIPYGFRQFQTCNLTDWDGSPDHPELLGLMNELARRVKSPRPAGPPAAPPPTPRPRPNRLKKAPLITAGVAALSLLVGIVGYRAYYKNKYGAGRNLNQNVATPTPGPVAGQPPGGGEAHQRAVEQTARGTAEADKGNHRGAIMFYDLAIEAKRDFAPAYFYRGMSRAMLNQNVRALADFRKVLELSNEEEQKLEAQQLIASIESPPPPPTRPANANAANTASANASTTNAGPRPPVVGQTAPTPEPARVQVAEMFSNNKEARYAATSKLVIARKNDPEAVLLAIKTAQAQPKNLNGVINTLVLLENVDQTILRKHRKEVEALLEAVKDNGPETADRAAKVRERLRS
jgi:tetratricopeptide (TPR) repeat protein